MLLDLGGGQLEGGHWELGGVFDDFLGREYSLKLGGLTVVISQPKFWHYYKGSGRLCC